MNEFSIRYPQSSYFVLERSDCLQPVTWKLVSPLELQVERVQVTGNLSKESQPGADFRKEAQKVFQHLSTGQPSYFTAHYQIAVLSVIVFSLLSELSLV